MRLLVATTNPGKLAEYRELLAGLRLELIDLGMAGIGDEVPETGSTFAENAEIKASGYARKSGLVTLADDSGLEVLALGGEPGVLSARYGGAGLDDVARYRLVLDKLARIPAQERQARFVCAIAIAIPDGTVQLVDGSIDGMIAFAPRGTQGFGYDPIFLLPDRDVTMAELPPLEKNLLSHRARATRKAYPLIEKLVANDPDRNRSVTY